LKLFLVENEKDEGAVNEEDGGWVRGVMGRL